LEDNNDKSAWKVVVIGYENVDREFAEEGVVEIYDHSENTWQILGHLPLLYSLAGMVSLDGSCYCLTCKPSWLIFGFSIGVNYRRDPFSFPPLVSTIPAFGLDDNATYRILTCASRLFLIAFGKVDEVEGAMILEFVVENKQPWKWSWKQIATMPPTMFSDLRIVSSAPWHFRCTGVGDVLCFVTTFYTKDYTHSNVVVSYSLKVLAYSLSTGSWSWLPSCNWDDHCAKHDKRGRFGPSVIPTAFQPRLDT